MNNPIQTLKEKASSLSKSQQKVADYILNNTTDVGFMTVEQLSIEIGTSTTTIMRLMTNIGYNGYSEFQRKLHEVLKQQASPYKRLEDNVKEDNQSERWNRYLNSQIKHIQTAAKLNPEETLDLVGKMIINAKHITCTSVRSGLPAAQYLTQNLNRMFGNANYVHADSSDWVDDVISMNDEHLLIAFSYPRYAKSVIHFLKEAKNREVKIIAITDSYSSPLTPYADIIIPCSVDSLASHNSIVPTIFLIDYIISTISLDYYDAVSSRLEGVGEVLANIDYHHRKND